MREELLRIIESKQNPKAVFGIQMADINSLYNALESVLISRADQKTKYVQYLKSLYSKESAVEVIRDFSIGYENDNIYIIQIGIIRSIGILESIVNRHHALSKSAKNQPSLVVKISDINPEFNVKPISNWNKLRNQIVHRPAEHVVPIAFSLQDIKDLHVVIHNVAENLNLYGLDFLGED